MLTFRSFSGRLERRAVNWVVSTTPLSDETGVPSGRSVGSLRYAWFCVLRPYDAPITSLVVGVKL